MANRIIELLRTEDLLVLEFEFINLDLFEAEGELPVRFMRLDEAQPAFIIVRFPPQHLVERDFHEEKTTADPLAPPPIESRMAGSSRLAFRIPNTIAFIPYSVRHLLDWSAWEPSVAPLAAPPGATRGDFNPLPPIAAPLPEQTAIELPYRLFLSPHAGLGWTHSPDAVTRAGRTELWHTRLGVRRDGRIDETVADQRTVRAIWTSDLDRHAPPPVPWTLPDADQRRQIVRLTTDFSITRTIRLPNGRRIVVTAYTPDPVQVNRLMLSALGGWLDGRGVWDMPDSLRKREHLSVEEWRHIAAMGRDEFVRIVVAGYVYPLGHRASHVIELERRFEAAPTPASANFGAYLRRHEYTVIRQPLKVYEPQRYPFKGLEMPLHRGVRILTLKTPFLDDTTRAPSRIRHTSGHAFWIRVDNRDFPFHIRGEDLEGGGHVEYNGALIFVSIDASPREIEFVRTAYRDDARRRVMLAGQRMTFAERLVGQPGETALTTSNLYFDTVAPVVADANQANFVPILDKADVRIPALEQILNGSQPVTIQLHDTYKSVGLAAPTNRGHVFAKVVGNLPLSFPSDRAGGLASPSMDITGISQTLGPVSGKLADLDGGKFNPAEFFSRNDATLLGGVKLRDVIDAVFDPLQFPKMVTERVPAVGVPTSTVTTLAWKPRVRMPSVVPSLEVSAATSLDLNTRIEKKLDGPGEPVTLVTGVMRTFAINFLGVARIRFDSVSFRSRRGEKLDFSAQLEAANPVEFLGALSFVNELRRFIPSGGFSDPPALSLSPAGVEVGYSLALPPLAVGVFALQNVSLSAGLKLPFTGDPARLSFGFAERHSPFLLTVSLFGGGGFFGMAVGLDKVVLVEAALEFGGSVSINLGVASGGVYVMAGIYFKLENGVAELAGYLRCGGSLEVLGLITISIEFYLELSYRAGKARGLARVTVKVEVACFSKSVTLTVEKSFGGSSGDPTFGQLIEPEDWLEYGNAFA